MFLCLGGLSSLLFSDYGVIWRFVRGAEHCVLKYERSTAELQTKEVQDAIGALDYFSVFGKWGRWIHMALLFYLFLVQGHRRLAWMEFTLHPPRFIIVLVTVPSCTLMTPIPTPYGWSNTLFLTYLVFAVVVLFESSDDDGPCDV